MINPILFNILIRHVENGLDVESIKNQEYKIAVKEKLGMMQ